MKSVVTLMIGILMGFLMIAEISAEEFDGVEFPAGSISFADSVQLFEAGTYTTQTDTSNVLGAPDYAGGTDGSTYLSLGNGGTIVLQFTDNALTASGDPDLDLWIFEVGSAVEATDVYISKDGSDWIAVGHISGSTSGIDIDAYVSNGVVVGENYLYVKLVDDELDDYQTGEWAGADIDAVGAISSVALPLSANPMSLVLPVPGDVSSFTCQGGVSPYAVTSFDEIVIEVDEGVAGNRFYVMGIASGSTTITVRDSAGASVEVAVTVGITDSQPISTYYPTTEEVAIGPIAIDGDISGQLYQIRGSLMGFPELMSLYQDYVAAHPDATPEEMETIMGYIMVILITGVDPYSD